MIPSKRVRDEVRIDSHRTPCNPSEKRKGRESKNSLVQTCQSSVPTAQGISDLISKAHQTSQAIIEAKKTKKRPRAPSPELPEVPSPNVIKRHSSVATDQKAQRIPVNAAVIAKVDTKCRPLQGQLNLPAVQAKEVMRGESAIPFPPEASFSSLQQLREWEVDQKPPYAWWVLIRTAILGAHEKRSRIEDISSAIASKYSYVNSSRQLTFVKANLSSGISNRREYPAQCRSR